MHLMHIFVEVIDRTSQTDHPVEHVIFDGELHDSAKKDTISHNPGGLSAMLSFASGSGYFPY